MEELENKIKELHSQVDLQRTTALKEMEGNKERINAEYQRQ